MALELLTFTGFKIPALIIEIGNVALLSGLLYLYIKSYREIKIGFTVGLILFASFLLLRSIYNIIFIITNTSSQFLVDTHSFIGGIIEFVGLIILLLITWNY